ncbi:large T antigen [Myotis horsfieldii polyomavirus 2]|nr:large T antigen [Myotis horsfieldii polyomavirus 2]
MDQFLERDEAKELMELLNIPKHCYGNLPMMKINYKKMCLIYHPDKGGDPAKMKRMNELWQKLNDGFCNARGTEVGFCNTFFWEEDFQTLGDVLGPAFHTRILRAWPACFMTPKVTCNCVHCLLVMQHKVLKLDTNKKCLGKPPPYGSETWEQWWQKFNASWDDLFDQTCDCNLFCDESLDTSDDDSPSQPTTSSAPRSPRSPPGESQGSFSATPPKPKKQKTSNAPTEFPDCLLCYLSHAIYSNKTFNAFLIYTTLEKGELLYAKLERFKIEFKSRHTYQKDAALLLMVTTTKRRVSAVKNFCANFCSISFLLCKAVTKPVECYRALCRDDFELKEENKPGLFNSEFEDGLDGPTVNWNHIAEFAVANNLEDPLLIMGYYLDFANNPTSCKKCDKKLMKIHYNYHEAHYLNAQLFEMSKSQKSICQQAADVVLAKKRLKIIESTRTELLTDRFKLFFDILSEKFSSTMILEYMAGVAWYSELFGNIESIVENILKNLVENIPKKRNVLFRGPINSGKTTLAAAILDLVGGKTLNINCPAEKLPFELGCAIDQYCVVFEDVKGQIALDKALQPGQGINNLDNLRDYLDGSVKVNLEKKHVNKKSQIFPPCIVTMNQYWLPQTLLVRFNYTLNFKPREYLKKSLDANDQLLCRRVMHSGLTILLLLIWYSPIANFTEEIQEKVAYWKGILDSYVGMDKFFQMQDNIREGKDPLAGIVEYE